MGVPPSGLKLPSKSSLIDAVLCHRPAFFGLRLPESLIDWGFDRKGESSVGTLITVAGSEIDTNSLVVLFVRFKGIKRGVSSAKVFVVAKYPRKISWIDLLSF